MLARTKLAEAPIKVPLPPRHAPREIAHQRGQVLTPPLPMVRTSGMSVATKGILSKKPETMAESQRSEITVKVGWPAVIRNK